MNKESLEHRVRALKDSLPPTVLLVAAAKTRDADEVPALVRQVAALSHLGVQGLMTMGPRFGDPEDARPYFRLTKNLFDQLAAENIPGARMKYLSMGMSNSYQLAIEEGANIVRIGTKLFGVRAQEL
ncbi:MAG: alanine racemase [Deltaproteobacteria bacterium]|nr:alanine racemase [Deltaproteobacteria bacterium]